ncbi:serine/threonine protein kinase [Paenibacillus sp. IB182363]|uniref:Serine/threonine protein kinase n=1 Tax=Paenibacillus oceani TaxID=2772510 RepID=A0A927CFL7_9BACL|nr:serine/threonine protein kinase [Paenibacillus oceani]
MGYGVTTSSKTVLTQGDIVCGKWNKRSYRIERLLGEGANGKVFLVGAGGRHFALKFGFDAVDLQMEVNVLRELDQKTGDPFLYDADDVMLNGMIYPFYVMRYVKGVPPEPYIRSNGSDWFYLIGLNLLRKLHALHHLGYGFGDLKSDNVLVSGYGEVELVDYGGVTARGRSVRQFTELYDCGFWNAGDRVAGDSYDLFGFAVFCLQIGGMGNRLQEISKELPQSRSKEDLLKLIDLCPKCKPVARILKKAATGRYRSSAEAAAEWEQAMNKPGPIMDPRRRKQSSGWIPAAFLGSIGLFVSVLYMFFFKG